MGRGRGWGAAAALLASATAAAQTGPYDGSYDLAYTALGGDLVVCWEMRAAQGCASVTAEGDGRLAPEGGIPLTPATLRAAEDALADALPLSLALRQDPHLPDVVTVTLSPGAPEALALAGSMDGGRFEAAPTVWGEVDAAAGYTGEGGLTGTVDVVAPAAGGWVSVAGEVWARFSLARQ